eukprot:33810_6
MWYWWEWRVQDKMSETQSFLSATNTEFGLEAEKYWKFWTRMILLTSSNLLGSRLQVQRELIASSSTLPNTSTKRVLLENPFLRPTSTTLFVASRRKTTSKLYWRQEVTQGVSSPTGCTTYSLVMETPEPHTTETCPIKSSPSTLLTHFWISISPRAFLERNSLSEAMRTIWFLLSESDFLKSSMAKT